VHFTREPIIESVIAAKEGYKLVVRNSKNPGHEEFLVDAVEIVSFGTAQFFRCMEKPRVFLAPISDYEVVETKESRTPLKAVSQERVIKIAGGKESGPREHKQKVQEEQPSEEKVEGESAEAQEPSGDRRKRRRRRRGRADRDEDQGSSQEDREDSQGEEISDLQKVAAALSEPSAATAPVKAEGAPSLLPPPSVLISETLSRYREGKAPRREDSHEANQEVGFFAETTDESFEDPEA
jgi:hypothetical protein